MRTLRSLGLSDEHISSHFNGAPANLRSAAGETLVAKAAAYDRMQERAAETRRAIAAKRVQPVQSAPSVPVPAVRMSALMIGPRRVQKLQTTESEMHSTGATDVLVVSRLDLYEAITRQVSDYFSN